jgi:hypothetical protein
MINSAGLRARDVERIRQQLGRSDTVLRIAAEWGIPNYADSANRARLRSDRVIQAQQHPPPNSSSSALSTTRNSNTMCIPVAVIGLPLAPPPQRPRMRNSRSKRRKPTSPPVRLRRSTIKRMRSRPNRSTRKPLNKCQIVLAKHESLKVTSVRCQPTRHLR